MPMNRIVFRLMVDDQASAGTLTMLPVTDRIHTEPFTYGGAVH